MGKTEMGRILTTASLVALAAGTASAGGIERSLLSVAPLFEDGNYVELTFGYFNPSVSGVGAGPFAGLTSGDMAGDYNDVSLAFKSDLNEQMSIAVILDQPLGADVLYPTANAPYPFAGSNATVDTQAMTFFLRYELENHVSLYGGVRLQTVNGDVGIIAPMLTPAFTNYAMNADKQTEVGYALGVAWEKPEIAARVALTYNSAINYDLDTTETGLAPFGLTGVMPVTTPQSVNLEFQTGVAENTLLFGLIRWVDWTEFEITPPYLGVPIVEYDNDTITYNIGIGRQFTEQWAGAVQIGYEPSSGTPQGNLGPTDGFTSIGIAGTYSIENTDISAGATWVNIGDTTTRTIGSDFTDNSGWGFGFQVSSNF